LVLWCRWRIDHVWNRRPGACRHLDHRVGYFGPGKLPEIGSALGKGISGFKKSFEGIEDDLKKVEKTDGTEQPAKKG